MQAARNRIRAVQPDKPRLPRRGHKRIHKIRSEQRQPPNSSALHPAGNTREHAHSRRAKQLRQNARHDFRTSRACVALVQVAEHCPDSGDDKTFASGGKPARGGFFARGRRMGRIGKRGSGNSGCRSALQCGTAKAGGALNRRRLTNRRRLYSHKTADVSQSPLFLRRLRKKRPNFKMRQSRARALRRNSTLSRGASLQITQGAGGNSNCGRRRLTRAPINPPA